MPESAFRIPVESTARATRQSTPVLRLAIVAVACLAIAGAAQHWVHRGHVTRDIGAGRARLRETPSGVAELWQQSAVKITIDPTLASLTPGGREPLLEAFATWATAVSALPQVTFDVSTQPGKAAQDGVNLLLVAPITEKGFEHALAITISYADDDSGVITEADTIFNSAYSWTEMAENTDEHACGGRFDLQNVATHEAGHFFGLGEDYDDTSTTMYFESNSCQTSKRQLTSSDVSVMTGLYAQAKTRVQGGCGGHASARSDISPTYWAMDARTCAGGDSNSSPTAWVAPVARTQRTWASTVTTLPSIGKAKRSPTC
jgi:hypothetical protein